MPSGGIYARAFENAGIGLLLLERENGNILHANAAFLQIAGRERNEVLGRSFWKPPMVADAHAGAEIHGHLLAGETVRGAELPFQTADGRWILLEVYGDPSDGLHQLNVRDATARQHAQLIEQLDVLGLLAGRTAIEFQDLHRALLAMGDLLLIGAGQGRPVLRELEEIRHSTARASAIAEQLLAFSGGVELHAQPLALNDLVESLMPALRRLLGPEIEVSYDLRPDVSPVMADPLQVRQVLLRLAANSREAMGRGGTFSVQTGNSNPAESRLRSADAGGPYGMLAVSDTGPGLDDPSWEHLYQPFFSTKANPGGLGLGLAAVYGIVRQSGGRIWAFSQPGEGATFRIYLPLAKADFPALPAQRTDRLPGLATILLVEANDGMRTTMTNLLRQRSYRVLPALDAKEALRVAGTQGPPDLLISRPDQEMALRLTAIQPQLRVLFLGGCAYGAAAEEHGAPPLTSILRMPFEPETLLAKVLDMLTQPL